jgi:hypothetical protein
LYFYFSKLSFGPSGFSFYAHVVRSALEAELFGDEIMRFPCFYQMVAWFLKSLIKKRLIQLVCMVTLKVRVVIEMERREI